MQLRRVHTLLCVPAVLHLKIAVLRCNPPKKTMLLQTRDPMLGETKERTLAESPVKKNPPSQREMRCRGVAIRLRSRCVLKTEMQTFKHSTASSPFHNKQAAEYKKAAEYPEKCKTTRTKLHYITHAKQLTATYDVLQLHSAG